MVTRLYIRDEVTPSFVEEKGIERKGNSRLFFQNVSLYGVSSMIVMTLALVSRYSCSSVIFYDMRDNSVAHDSRH